MRPPFISEATAADVLRVGKSINFSGPRCDDESWGARASAGGCGGGGGGRVVLREPRRAGRSGVRGEAEDRRALRGVLFDRYKFAEHCDAVKRYLLLGQGDFHHYLMDLVGPDLAEPASTVSAYKLTGTLESAIRASNAQFDAPDVLDRLRVRMMPHAGAEEKGWDVFSLEYVVDDPLSTVFTEQAMGKYLRVFNFLWRLKRVEHSLCATWQTMKPNVAAALQREGVAGPPARRSRESSGGVTRCAARCTTSSPTCSTTSVFRGAGGILGALLARDGGGVGPGLAHPRARAVPRHHPREGPPRTQVAAPDQHLGHAVRGHPSVQGLRGQALDVARDAAMRSSSRSSGWSSARRRASGAASRGKTRRVETGC